MRIDARQVLLTWAPPLAVCAVLAACATPRLEPEPDDGLLRVETSLLDELFVAPEVSLANYRRVMLDPVEVNFEEGWRQRHPDIDERQIEALRARLADLLQEVLVAELARGGYVVAESPAPDVLRLRASLENVDFPAPETYSDVKTYVYSNGHMTLRLLAFDALSTALVARARDYEEDPHKRIMDRADRVTTFIAAKRMCEEWAQAVRSALDVARVRAGARQLPQ